MLTLRALTVEDAIEVQRICAHAEVARFLGGLPTDGREGWKQRLGHIHNDHARLLGAFEGAGGAEGALRGLAMLEGTSRTRRRHVARVWVAVDPAAWRRGVARALLDALIDAADRWFGFVRLELDVFADHAPAIALYESVGFEVECRKRCDMLRDGALVDGLHMARIRPGFVPPPEVGTAPAIPPRREPLGALSIRPIHVDDAAAMAALHETESVIDGTFQMPFQSERDWRARLLGNDAGRVRTLVAVAGDRVIGASALFPMGESPRIAHALGFGIAVHPDAQGRGVGDALTRAVLEIADRWVGARRVQLEVYPDNARAIALYRRHGFEVEGTQRLTALRRGTYADAIMMGRVRAPRPASGG